MLQLLFAARPAARKRIHRPIISALATRFPNRARHTIARRICALTVTLALLATGSVASAQCPAKPPLKNYDGTGLNPCICFIPGEQVGAVFSAPAADYPLEILSVGIYWKSTFGGNPPINEKAVHIYSGGLPNPGSPVHTMLLPLLVDGQLNVFTPANPVVINAGPMTVTLELLNQSSGNTFAGSVVDDGNGCRPGQNVVFTSNQWLDACPLGVPGDWVFELTYRPCTSTVPASPTTWGSVKTLYSSSQ